MPFTPDVSKQVYEPGMDTITNNSRVRATFSNPNGVNWMDGIGAPASIAPGATNTLTAAQMLTGIVVSQPSAPNTMTLDTAANIVAAVNANSSGAYVGDYVCVLIVNGQGTNTITLSAGSGGGFDTNQTAGSRIISPNTSKYCFVRLTNVTQGSEAYVVYS